MENCHPIKKRSENIEAQTSFYKDWKNITKMIIVMNDEWSSFKSTKCDSSRENEEKKLWTVSTHIYSKIQLFVIRHNNSISFEIIVSKSQK